MQYTRRSTTRECQTFLSCAPIQHHCHFTGFSCFTVISPRARQRNFQVSPSSTVSLFLSQSTKKTLPRKMTVHSMSAVLLQLCESKRCSILCKCLEVWSNPFYYCESEIHTNTSWNLFDFDIMPFFKNLFCPKWFKNKGSFGEKGGEVWQALSELFVLSET